MSPVGPIERIVLDYMFGPEVPCDDRFVREVLQVARHVEVVPVPNSANLAAQALVAAIVDKGLDQTPMGWTIYRQDGRLALGILTINPAAQERAA